jgi:hypothetical protein
VFICCLQTFLIVHKWTVPFIFCQFLPVTTQAEESDIPPASEGRATIGIGKPVAHRDRSGFWKWSVLSRTMFKPNTDFIVIESELNWNIGCLVKRNSVKMVLRFNIRRLAQETDVSGFKFRLFQLKNISVVMLTSYGGARIGCITNANI